MTQRPQHGHCASGEPQASWGKRRPPVHFQRSGGASQHPAVMGTSRWRDGRERHPAPSKQPTPQQRKREEAPAHPSPSTTGRTGGEKATRLTGPPTPSQGHQAPHRFTTATLRPRVPGKGSHSVHLPETSPTQCGPWVTAPV